MARFRCIDQGESQHSDTDISQYTSERVTIALSDLVESQY